MNKKTVVEEAVIQMKNLEDALKENAKGILASTMKQEINSLVKESLKEQDEVETDDEEEVDLESPEGEEDVEDDEDDDIFAGLDDEDDDMDVVDTDMDDEDMDVVDTDMDDEDEDMDVVDTDMDDEDEEETIDMRGASDEDVAVVFSKMGKNDKVSIEKVGDYFNLKDDENDTEYIIKLNESEEDYLNEIGDDETLYELEVDGGSGDYGLGEDMMTYEDMSYDDLDEVENWDSLKKRSQVSMTEAKQKTGSASKFKYSKKPNQEGGFNTKMKEGSKRYGKSGKANFDFDNEDPNSEIVMKIVNKIKGAKKSETKEATRTLGSGSNFRKGGLPKPRAHSKNNTAINEEVEILREKNEEYRKALDLFRTKLNEVAVFNSNLAYATRLFTEHSTTKQEKINVLRRFDNVESLKESKNLYQILKNELSNNSLSDKSINESINRTVMKSPSTGSAVNLIESKTYENPQFLRMKDLMGKIK